VSVLGFWAAVIPIAASLYGAVSYLIEQAERRRELDVRRKVADRRSAFESEIQARLAAAGKNWWVDPWAGYLRDKVDSFEDRWLGHYGVAPAHITFDEFDLHASMSFSGIDSSRESRRQWVLLLGSLVGVVLLAFDTL
jgi:hypothetical protein